MHSHSPSKGETKKRTVAMSSSPEPVQIVFNKPKCQYAVSDLTETLVTTILSDYEANRTMIDGFYN